MVGSGVVLVCWLCVVAGGCAFGTVLDCWLLVWLGVGCSYYSGGGRGVCGCVSACF